MSQNSNIESVLHETRTFDPPENFDSRINGAYIGSMEEYKEMHEKSLQDPDGFWGLVADELDWFERWDTVLDGDDTDYEGSVPPSLGLIPPESKKLCRYLPVERWKKLSPHVQALAVPRHVD